jgi:hypothetical protein
MPRMADTVHEFRHARLLQLIEQKGSVQALADAVGRSHAQLSQLRNQSAHSVSGKRRRIGDDLARDIEVKLKLPRGWMDTQARDDILYSLASVAHDLSHQPATLPPTLLSWEDVMHSHADLPAVFEVDLVDDAMSPVAGQGTRVKFRRQTTARPGQAVLVRTGAGAVYFREYREPAPGQWQAAPANPAFPTIDLQREGAQVIAVFIGLDTDWSNLQR